MPARVGCALQILSPTSAYITPLCTILQCTVHTYIRLWMSVMFRDFLWAMCPPCCQHQSEAMNTYICYWQIRLFCFVSLCGRLCKFDLTYIRRGDYWTFSMLYNLKKLLRTDTNEFLLTFPVTCLASVCLLHTFFFHTVILVQQICVLKLTETFEQFISDFLKLCFFVHH